MFVEVQMLIKCKTWEKAYEKTYNNLYYLYRLKLHELTKKDWIN
jgi:hypothetical protein